jgi:plasmid stabilization system protein ParE
MSTSPNEPSKLGGNTEARRIMKGAAAAALAAFNASYLIEQSTRSQTISYALLDSTVALAAWMLDHDTDSYHKISRAFLGGPPSGNLTRDHLLDNVTLYRLIGTGVSAARSYWESARAQAAAAGQTPTPGHPPGRVQRLPRRDLPGPRSWVQIGYPTLMYYNKPARGGHFAAWEEPQLFSEELRAAFRSLRKPEIRGSARRALLVHVES